MRGESRRAWVWALVAGGIVLGTGFLARAGSPGVYEDAKYGYKIRPPKDWTTVPLATDEEWVIAKFLSDRSYTWTDPKEGFTSEHKPILSVIAFVADIVKKRGVEKGVSGDDEIWLRFNNPYKDYLDYLRRTYSGGGWFVSEEKEDEQDGVKVTEREIKVEKLTSDGPKRLIAWVFHTEVVDYAVQCEVLESAYPKLKRQVYAALKSFKLIPRKGGSLAPVTTGDAAKTPDESEMKPEERKSYRKTTEETLHRKAEASLPEGWTAKQMGRFFVLNHTDEKYARKVVAQAEAVWDWLDDTFPYVGPGEYVRSPILRICKDEDEERAFRTGTGVGWTSGIEITTHKDRGSGAMSYEFEWVNRRVMEIWFDHHDRDLYWAFPYWLDGGLGQFIGTARLKGKRLDFAPDDWERDGLRESERKGELTSPHDLLLLDRSTFFDNPNRIKQSAAFLRFVLASHDRKLKGVLETYVKALQEVVKAEKAKEKADTGEDYKAPQTEEEEDAAYKKRTEMWKEKEKETLQTLFDQTFQGWDDKDWKRLDDKYRKSL